ncbi:MAG: 50S ribosomal protein L11, partial [Candidatus Dadabacteria bacterium]|nr:50S ribosomal protein L11 [Candidatus Dadabacteria bacterium]NIS07788.1 50S ribosomal protein L11 [Candidatus Dadabacteria bacterium]NIY21410.1 50S ribosomal protein L11 [Candidatus Dadabacteria bacterium]
SGEVPRVKAGSVTKDQVEDIANTKMEDLNADTIESAVRIIEGTAKSMGLDVQ